MSINSYLRPAIIPVIRTIARSTQSNLDHAPLIQASLFTGMVERGAMCNFGSKHGLCCVIMSIYVYQANRAPFILQVQYV